MVDGWVHSYSGKVRDLYTSATQPGRILMVASDRVSAFDHVLEPDIPGKGVLLTTLSRWWFAQLSEVANHLIDDEIPVQARGRGMLVKTLDMYPIECVVRGYLAGSGWLEYRAHGTVCGIALPAGLSDGDRLPAPIYTPAWKAPMGEHDENITFERTIELVGAQVATALRNQSLAIFQRASTIAEARGVILADTKFEFGADEDGVLTLGDEVLTSDSSRYWDADRYAAGGSDRLASFDKQIVRTWLSAHWNKTGPPPTLPPWIVEQTAHQYRELIERLTSA